MGELVTEEMLEEWDEHAEYYFGEGGETGALATRTCALVAEVRRLKSLCETLARAANAATEDADAEAHAAGYARAERDVVAWLDELPTPDCPVCHGEPLDDPTDNCDECGGLGFDVVIEKERERTRNAIEQGAHRGAAKEGT